MTGCRIVRVETLFFQPLQDFLVELYVQAVMRMEIVRSGQPGVKHTKTVRRDMRLQYRFDLRPCKLTCQFTGVILNEADSLAGTQPGSDSSRQISAAHSAGKRIILIWRICCCRWMAFPRVRCWMQRRW